MSIQTPDCPGQTKLRARWVAYGTCVIIRAACSLVSKPAKEGANTSKSPATHNQRENTTSPASRSTRRPSPWFLVWAPLVGSLILIGLAAGKIPGWQLMWLVSLAIYFSLKWAVWAHASHRPTVHNLHATVAYYFGWPGMRPAEFLSSKEKASRPAPTDWAIALGKMTFGGTSIALATKLAATENELLAAWFFMVGFVVTIHFGLFHLLALVWQTRGVALVRVMNSPMAAATLSDFWSRRWNMPFRDAAHSLVFRPVARRWGLTAATLATFAFSGVIHELAISWPAGSGWGLPTGYFLLQGVGVLLQRHCVPSKTTRGSVLINRCITAVVILAPVPMLCHAPFIKEVIVPML